MTQIGSAKFEIPGSQMYSKEYCDTDVRHLCNTESIVVSWVDKHKRNNKKNVIKEKIFFHTRKCVPAILVVPIYDEVYDYWVSNECPSFATIKDWRKMNANERVLAHLQNRAEDERGVLIDYHVELD